MRARNNFNQPYYLLWKHVLVVEHVGYDILKNFHWHGNQHQRVLVVEHGGHDI